MKHVNIFKYAILLFLSVTVSSCGKDEAGTGLQGEWNWVQSYGGEAGETLTPVSTMSTAKLVIDEFTYREYRNDSLIYETSYILTVTDYHPFSTSNTVIE